MLCRALATVLTIVLTTGYVYGQAYPDKPIRVVAGQAGTGPDVVARIIAPDVSALLGQPVIVENRPTVVGPEMVAKGPPDGYTLLLQANGSAWNALLVRKLSYDAVKDLAPITMVARYPSLVVVHPSLGVSSVKELIAMAKAKPGVLNGSTGSTGGAGHLALELFKSMAGVNITRVPYTSGSQEIADLLSGRVQMTMGTGPEMAPHIKSGKLRGLAVTTAQPSQMFPELVTVAASGLPGFVFESSYNLLAQGSTPAAVINRLNRDFVTVLQRPNIKQLIFDSGAEVATTSPEGLIAVREGELTRLGKVLKEAGITPE